MPEEIEECSTCVSWVPMGRREDMPDSAFCELRAERTGCTVWCERYMSRNNPHTLMVDKMLRERKVKE